jgi:hypothetical protein
MEQLNLFDDPVPQDPSTYLEGVKILLARMDTNPEEFSFTDGPWAPLINNLSQAKHGLYEMEIDALCVKLRQVLRSNFTSEVLRILAKATK